MLVLQADSAFSQQVVADDAGLFLGQVLTRIALGTEDLVLVVLMVAFERLSLGSLANRLADDPLASVLYLELLGDVDEGVKALLRDVRYRVH